MEFDRDRPRRADASDGPDMDKLMDDIQAYLRDEDLPGEAVLEGEPIEVVPGGFLPGGDPHVLGRVGALARYGSYTVQAIAMAALLVVVNLSWSTWQLMGLALLAVLGCGIVSVILLLGVEARVRLLCDIEGNTRRIAGNKERIAQLLERIWIV